MHCVVKNIILRFKFTNPPACKWAQTIKMMRKLLVERLLLVSFFAWFALPASGELYTFNTSTNNSVADSAKMIKDVPKIAKDTSWKVGGFISLNYNQVTLVNWAAGGQNMLSGSVVGNLFANYKRGKASWDNTLDFGYGMLESGTAKTQKSDDRIELNSKYGYTIKDKINYSALINMKTQFAPGYNYPNDSTVISRFLAPAYITLALGFDYKPASYFSLFLSPATGRLTIVDDQQLADAGQFGVTPATYNANGVKLTSGKLYNAAFGAYLRMHFQKDLIKNVNLLSNLSLFNNYTDPVVANRENCTVDWLSMLTAKVGKLFSFSIIAHVIYDNNISIPTYGTKMVGSVVENNVVVGSGPKTQFQEALGVGLSYKFAK